MGSSRLKEEIEMVSPYKVACASGLPGAWVVTYFGRVNPVFPPRRRKATAERHLLAGHRVFRWLWQLEMGGDDMMPAALKWAASIILDASCGSACAEPPAWDNEWNPSDGVQKAALKSAAEFLINWVSGDVPPDTKLKVRAWGLLWPAVWRAVTWSPPTPDSISDALAEMELIEEAPPPQSE